VGLAAVTLDCRLMMGCVADHASAVGSAGMPPQAWLRQLFPSVPDAGILRSAGETCWMICPGCWTDGWLACE